MVRIINENEQSYTIKDIIRNYPKFLKKVRNYVYNNTSHKFDSPDDIPNEFLIKYYGNHRWYDSDFIGGFWGLNKMESKKVNESTEKPIDYFGVLSSLDKKMVEICRYAKYFEDNIFDNGKTMNYFDYGLVDVIEFERREDDVFAIRTDVYPTWVDAMVDLSSGTVDWMLFVPSAEDYYTGSEKLTDDDIKKMNDSVISFKVDVNNLYNEMKANGMI